MTVYHFLFVPLTIGLSLLVALMQTAWYRTGNAKYLAMTKFWGKIFLINFAMGVVTGIVQEFQFGMNWSDYSRFVGDVFGAPLAIEALIAFFLEATFIGLWIFGWDRLPRLSHLACIWLVAIGDKPLGVLHPRRELVDAAPGRLPDQPGARPGRADEPLGGVEQLDDRVAFPHVATASFLTAAAFVIGVSAWHLYRRQHTAVMRESLKMGLRRRADLRCWGSRSPATCRPR